MKTTLDLPDALVKQVKTRAEREGRKLKDMVAELLRKGLVRSNTAPLPARTLKSARIKKDPVTGLPLIACDANAPARDMTAEDLISLEQESQKREDLERLGLSF